MDTEQNLNKLMADCSANVQLLCLLKPEPEPSVARQLQSGRGAVTTNQRLSSVFICSFAVIAVAVLFVVALLWTAVSPLQSAAHSPHLLDGEMAVIYRVEQTQTEPGRQAATSGSVYSTRQSDIEWLQIVTQLKRQLNKALMVRKLHRLVSQQTTALYKLKYSGVV